MSVIDPYAFLSPATAAASGGHTPALRTPMERSHLAAGATITDVGGWRVAEYPDTAADLWIADRSHLGKLDLRGTAEELDSLTGGLEPGHARDDGGVWTLRLTATHGYVICGFDRVSELRERIGGAAVDITCAMAAVEIGGAEWREVFMRSSGSDVREKSFPANTCVAGSVMRCGALLLNAGDRILMLIGWEFGEYFWEAILDAGVNLGITPVSPLGDPTKQEQEVEA
jgi:glycine cleavage system aminomethyltransferase T